jgi:hypothetical protein
MRVNIDLRNSSVSHSVPVCLFSNICCTKDGRNDELQAAAGNVGSAAYAGSYGLDNLRIRVAAVCVVHQVHASAGIYDRQRNMTTHVCARGSMI